jgi:hypothetical protein
VRGQNTNGKQEYLNKKNILDNNKKIYFFSSLCIVSEAKREDEKEEEGLVKLQLGY